MPNIVSKAPIQIPARSIRQWLRDHKIDEIDTIIIKQTEPEIKKDSKDYKKYVKKAKADYISKVYQSYDKYINSNYKIEVNDKVVERLKNSF